ncbi:MAG: DUF2905 domain-containing protein [bacterium]
MNHRKMINLQLLGKFCLLIGAILLIIGVAFLLLSRLGVVRLPGDIVIQKPNLVVYIPIASGIIVSIILTLLFNLIFWRK